MKKKKKKKIITKRRSQIQYKKIKKKAKKPQKSSPEIHIAETPPLAMITPPEGFMAVSMSQAMMEYGKPVLEFVEKGAVKDPNDAFQLLIPLWNYGLSQKPEVVKEDKNMIINEIRKTLKLNEQEAEEFFDFMIKRKEYLLPDEIQPEDPRTMFIRKEKHYIISRFDYNSLRLSTKPYLPKEADLKLIGILHIMDRLARSFNTKDIDSPEYDIWESNFLALKELAGDRFINWMVFKGLKEDIDTFSFIASLFLDFIYSSSFETGITLSAVSNPELGVFLFDYILRKMSAEPYDYVKIPPALKLFYQFLSEIGYLDDPESFIKIIDTMEPALIEILQGRYS